MSICKAICGIAILFIMLAIGYYIAIYKLTKAMITTSNNLEFITPPGGSEFKRGANWALDYLYYRMFKK